MGKGTLTVATHRQLLTAVWGQAHEHDVQYLRASSASFARNWKPTRRPRR